MATWQLIEHASLTLIGVLQARMNAALPTSNVLVQVATVGAFADLRNTTRPTVTCFLYRILENAELRNSPMRRTPDGGLRRQPMVLELCYLVTPWGVRADDSANADAAAAREEQQMMGLVLQSLYEHAELSRAELHEDPDPTRPRVWGETDTVQIVLDSLPIEDMYRIWDASELSYRLSAAYRLRVLALDALEVVHPARVVDAALRIGRVS